MFLKCLYLFMMIMSGGTLQVVGHPSYFPIVPISKVEFTNDRSTFHYLPDMPEVKFCHHVAPLENGNIFVAGGYNQIICFLY
jgi:hypothetical protein